MTYAPPPPTPYGSAPDSYGPKTSAAAVTSLVTGIIGCLVITPFIAIVTGIVGIIATKNPNVKGRGMAIAGLILGVLWLGGLALSGGTIAAFLASSQAPAELAKSFTDDLVNRRTDAAFAKSTGMTKQEIDEMAETLSGWGAVTDITLAQRNATVNNGQTRWTFIGTATFANRPQAPADFVVDKQADDTYRVAGAHFK